VIPIFIPRSFQRKPVRLPDSMVTGAMGFRFWKLRTDEMKIKNQD
jgi:hypothetical protein